MLAAVKKAGVTHMICHNYRRIPAVMLAKQLIDDGQLGEIRHYRGTYLQDWIADPKFPLVWRLDKNKAGSGALGDIAAHSIDLARFLVGEITEVAGDLKTFIKTRPLPDNPKKTGRVTVDDASTSLVRFKNGAIGTIEATPHGARPQELQPLRDQRQPRQPGVRPRADERARGLLRDRQAERARLPHASWSPKPSIPTSRRGGRRAHHRLRAHLHAHGVRPARGDRRRQGAEPNFEDGVRNQRVLGAIEKAAATRAAGITL